MRGFAVFAPVGSSRTYQRFFGGMALCISGVQTVSIVFEVTNQDALLPVSIALDVANHDAPYCLSCSR